MPRLKAALKAVRTRQKNKENKKKLEESNTKETPTTTKEKIRVEPQKELKFRIDEVENDILDALGTNKGDFVSRDQYQRHLEIRGQKLSSLMLQLEKLRKQLKDPSWKSAAEIGGFFKEFGITKGLDAFKAKVDTTFKQQGPSVGVKIPKRQSDPEPYRKGGLATGKKGTQFFPHKITRKKGTR